MVTLRSSQLPRHLFAMCWTAREGFRSHVVFIVVCLDLARGHGTILCTVLWFEPPPLQPVSSEQ